MWSGYLIDYIITLTRADKIMLTHADSATVALIIVLSANTLTSYGYMNDVINYVIMTQQSCLRWYSNSDSATLTLTNQRRRRWPEIRWHGMVIESCSRHQADSCCVTNSNPNQSEKTSLVRNSLTCHGYVSHAHVIKLTHVESSAVTLTNQRRWRRATNNILLTIS